MAKRIINYGDAPNALGADSIRTAFEKTKLNFDELYSAVSNTSVVLSVSVGQGLTQNSTLGNVEIAANISTIEIQSSSLIMGLNNNLDGNNTVTIADSSMPLVIDIDPDITANSITVDNSNVNLNLSVGGWIVVSTAQNITATGTDQATAHILGSTLNVVTTADENSGVKLPSDTYVGTSVYVLNKSANNILVYPTEDGSINSGSANAAVTLNSNSTITLLKTSSTEWFTF